MVVGWADGFAQSENQMVKASSPVRRSFSSRRRFWKTLEDCKVNADWLGHAWSFLSHWIIEASSIGLGLKAVQIWKGLWYYLVLLGHYMALYCSFSMFFVSSLEVSATSRCFSFCHGLEHSGLFIWRARLGRASAVCTLLWLSSWWPLDGPRYS